MPIKRNTRKSRAPRKKTTHKRTARKNTVGRLQYIQAIASPRRMTPAVRAEAAKIISQGPISKAADTRIEHASGSNADHNIMRNVVLMVPTKSQADVAKKLADIRDNDTGLWSKVKNFMSRNAVPMVAGMSVGLLLIALDSNAVRSGVANMLFKPVTDSVIHQPKHIKMTPAQRANNIIPGVVERIWETGRARASTPGSMPRHSPFKMPPGAVKSWAEAQGIMSKRLSGAWDYAKEAIRDDLQSDKENIQRIWETGRARASTPGSMPRRSPFKMPPGAVTSLADAQEVMSKRLSGAWDSIVTHAQALYAAVPSY